MNKLKIKSAKKFIFFAISRASLLTFLIGIMIVTPTLTIFYKNKKDAIDEKFIGKKASYQGVITLWNVDTFEGGSSSKVSFLESVAASFEKKYKGALIKVENLTIDEMIANLKMGNVPNLFSFGTGVAGYLEDKMIKLPESIVKGVFSNFYSAGLKSGELKAMAYSFGGYVLISSKDRIDKANKEYEGSLKNLIKELSYDLKLKKKTKHVYSITFGGNDFTHANNLFSRAFNENISTLLSNGILDESYNKQTTYGAYNNFTSRKASILLGTQRDIARMENRIKAGVESDVYFEAFSEYTDLVNYISIIEGDMNALNVCKDFISFLMSDEVQLWLSKIGLLSVKWLDLYDDGAMNLLEEAINEQTIVPNVF